MGRKKIVIPVMRYSGLPVTLSNQEAYRQEWEAGYDKILAKHTKGTNAEGDSVYDMLSVQKDTDELETALKEKYSVIEYWPQLRTYQQWKKKMEEYDAPILIAKSQEAPYRLVYVIMDVPFA